MSTQVSTDATASSTSRSEPWARRLEAVETALRRAGRDDLISTGLSAARSLIPLLDNTDQADAAQQRLREVMRAIKQCAVEPDRPIDGDVLEQIKQLVAPTSAVQPIPAAQDLLAGFGDSSDDELAALVSAVETPDLDTPRTSARTAGIGTLREPLESMRGTPEASTPILMKGELQDGLLSDLIQLFSQNKETGRLYLEGTSSTASLYFINGELSDAECGSHGGEEAFFHLMQINEGRFSYQRGVSSNHQRIHRSAQHLIMDTLRLLDEGSEGRSDP